MKIVEVELINHVVIPAVFHINLKDKSDVICIDGLNGSGKSFLINNIHPLSSNRRFKDRYPILKGKSGLKRIVYDIGNSELLEIIHEYTVNGKRHSCKSYCNIIRNNVVEEINPTGHTGNFESIIRKYLFFDNDTFVCSFLSPKADSIVNATSTKRKDILKNTMKSSKILENVIDKNREILTEANSSVKIYNKQMEDAYKNLPYKSLSEFEEVINSLSEDIRSLIGKKRISSEQKDEYVKQLTQYQNLDMKDLSIIKSYIDILDVIGIGNMKDAFDKLDFKKKNLGILEYQLNVNRKHLNDLDEKISNHCDVGNITSLIRSNEEELAEHIASISKIVDNPEQLYLLLSKLAQLKTLLCDLDTVDLTGIDLNVDIQVQLSDAYSSLDNKKEFITEFNNKLNSSSDREEILNVTKGSNCDTCDLYIKYVKNTEYIKANSSKFEKTMDELVEIERIVTNIKRIDMINERLQECIKDIMGTSKIKKLKHLELSNTVIMIRESIYSNNVVSIIDDYVDRIRFLNSRVSKLKDEIAESYKLVAKSSTTNLEDLKNERLVINNSTNIIRSNIQEDIAFVDLFDEFSIKRGSLYDNMSKFELEFKYTELVNVNDIMKKLSYDIKLLDSNIEKYESDIFIKNKQISKFQENMKMLESLNSYLVEKKIESTKHTVLKEILEKRIPLKLMESNMSFIENTVNSIMEENEINLSMDILIEENDVRIEVTTRNQTVDDIAMCSSGELCLLGVVLNAVLMHIIGYSIISFDEMDSNLDVVYRESFHNVIFSILEKLNIEQVFCVSHNISFDMNVGHIVIGEYDVERLHGEIIEYN